MFQICILVLAIHGTVIKADESSEKITQKRGLGDLGYGSGQGSVDHGHGGISYSSISHGSSASGLGNIISSVGYGHGNFDSAVGYDHKGFELSSGHGYGALGHTGLGGAQVQVNTITQQVPVSVPQPVPVTVNRPVPVPVPAPYPVTVPRPVPVHIPQPIPVTVVRPVPVTVSRPVPVPVPQPVPVPVPQPYTVPVPQAVPVHVPQPVAVPVPHPVTLEVPADNAGTGGFGSGVAALGHGYEFGHTSAGLYGKH